MKSVTLHCGWQTGLTSFALAFSVVFDIKPERHDDISKFTNTQLSQVNCKNCRERREGIKNITMHIVSDKCQPPVSCYALTRESVNDVRKRRGGFSNNFNEFLRQYFATTAIKVCAISL